MTTLTLTHKQIYHKVRLLNLPNINWKLVSFLTMLFFVAMLVLYVLLVNKLTDGVYLIKSYNKEMSILSRDNKMLETTFAQSGLLGKVTEQAKNLNFEKTTQVTYVHILDSPLAKVK